MAQSIKQLSIVEIHDLFEGLGFPRFRVTQLLDWIYVKGVSSYAEMTNLPKQMRLQLSESYPLNRATIIDKQISKDGSRKYLIEFEDGLLGETVGLPAEDGRLSVCVSSQVGCAMECSFCATGRQGLKRNLYPGEIIDQVLAVQDDFCERVTNVVVMGQGEPFANYDNMIESLKILNDEKLLNIGARHITISTCGIISGIEKLSNENEQFTLAVSLHAARQPLRDSIMPGVKNQSLEDLRKALTAYAEKTHRRFSFEYALMKDINDSQEDLESLISYCKPLLCHVNLIPLNEIDDSPYKPVSKKIMNSWQHALESKGIACSIRNSRGSDIAGACGQLAAKHINF